MPFAGNTGGMATQSRPAAPLPVLITRPEPQASRFAAELTSHLGDMVTPVLAPLMEQVTLSPPFPPAAALVLTSESAVLALPGLAGPLPDRAWCVGSRTAAAARAAGLQAVSAEGDAAALAAQIAAAGEPGPLLWLRGEEVAGDLAGDLAARGIPLLQAVVYRQEPRPLSAAARSLLSGQAPVIVPLFSPRSARLLALAAKDATAPLHLCALSPAVAAAGATLPAASRRVAARPTGGALLETIRDTARALLSA